LPSETPGKRVGDVLNGPGATIAISAQGRQAAEAVAALSRLVENRFEEER